MQTAALRALLLGLAAERAGRGSFCPSEAARELGGDWRARMDEVRQVAAALQAEGWLQATQAGVPVDPLAARGPIRLRLADQAARAVDRVSSGASAITPSSMAEANTKAKRSPKVPAMIPSAGGPKK